MFSRLKSIISSFRNAGRPDTELQGYAPETVGVDPWERLAEQPLSVDAQLAIANQRMSEEMVRQRIRENVQKFRESSDNPASMWALSFVDPFDWAMDTPDFYPGLGVGGGGWGVPWLLNKQGRGDFLPVYINEMGLKLIRDWSRRICAFNEFALNALENRISYIVGKGFQYSVVAKRNSTTPAQSLDNEEGTEPSRLAELAQAVLDEFISRSRWNEREQEVVKRCDRDGEAFLRFFHIGGGRTAVRFVEPEYVTQGQSYQAGERQADDIWRQYGVNSEPGDIEDVQSYSVVENPIGNWMTRDVPASDILHIKVNTDFDSKRGLPTLFPVRKNLERADKLLRNMSVMAQVQATFAVIRKHKQFGPSSVSAYQQAATDLNVTMPVSGRSLAMRQLQPGSIIDASDKTEYEFPSANVDASGLVAVLQAELRACAARLVMPEFMLTVDASNANFASTMVAESPWVKKGERDQSFFARHFGDGDYGQSKSHGAMWKVLANAVEGGLLPREALTQLEIQVEGPTLAVRNKREETSRAEVLNRAGILSDTTWAKWESVDYEQEKQLGASPKQQSQPGSDPFGKHLDANGIPRYRNGKEVKNGTNGQEPAGFGSETPEPAPPGSAAGK